MNIQLTLDKSKLDQAKLMYAELAGVWPKVISRGINKTLTTVRAAAVDEIYKDLNLTKTIIRESFTIKSATYSNGSGFLSSKSKPIPLIKFTGTRALARGGVSVKVKRGDPTTKLIHAFIAQKKAAKTGDELGPAVFERSGGNFGKPFNLLKNYAALPKQYRLPIDQLYGPRITDIYASGPVISAVQTKAGDVYTSNVENELDYELSKLP